LGEVTLNPAKAHSQIIMPVVEKLLKQLEISAEEIDLFAATQGPGSFTGLRVGISTVKGLADGVNKPVIGVSTLEAMSYMFGFSDNMICTIIDARRNQVYYALYQYVNGNITVVMEPDVEDISILLNKLSCLNKPIIFTGDCVEKFTDEIKSTMNTNGVIPMRAHCAGVAVSAGILAEKTYLKNEYKKIEPDYMIKAYVDQE
jgi:tRNA threonylcarbamoyladenosine biosynthesis protein TsaB